jgi:hypothetical protein
MGVMQDFKMLKWVVHIVTTGLVRVQQTFNVSGSQGTLLPIVLHAWIKSTSSCTQLSALEHPQRRHTAGSSKVRLQPGDLDWKEMSAEALRQLSGGKV